MKFPSMTGPHIKSGLDPAPPGVGMLLLFFVRTAMSVLRRHCKVSVSLAHPTRWISASY